ncbi:MAG TPA: hypothetical protein VIX73_07560 [Kofleriaceae bacterium]
MCDLLEPETAEILLVDPAHDTRLVFVDDRDRVLPARAIALALQPIAEAGPAGDPTISHAGSQRLAGARANRLELHLMASALNERGGLIDRIGELHLLTGHVVIESASTITDQIADDKSHLDRVAAQTRLIAADDHVAALCFAEHLPQARACMKIIARSSIIDVGNTFSVAKTESLDHLRATIGLDVEAELLLTVVVLGPSAIASDLHIASRFTPRQLPRALCRLLRDRAIG